MPATRESPHFLTQSLASTSADASALCPALLTWRRQRLSAWSLSIGAPIPNQPALHTPGKPPSEAWQSGPLRVSACTLSGAHSSVCTHRHTHECAHSPPCTKCARTHLSVHSRTCVCAHSHMGACTLTDAHTRVHAHTLKYTHKHMHTHRCAHMGAHTQTHTLGCTRTQKHTGACALRHAHSQTPTHAGVHTLRHAGACTHTHVCTLRHAHTRSHMQVLLPFPTP